MARRSDHTREELASLILDTAAAIVREHGREGLTARALSKAIGYVPGTLYHVFGSMDGIILQLNARTLEELHRSLSALRLAGPDVTGDLLCMADAYRKFIRKHRNEWLLLFDSRLPETRADDDWYQTKVDGLFQVLESVITPLFDAHENTRRKLAARVLWSSLHGLCYLEEKGQFHTIGRNADIAEMIRFQVSHLVAGLETSTHDRRKK